MSVAPRTHGSALFTRGQTQALTLATLGTAKEQQRIDDLSLDTTKRYIHHYNFPPFSVGETGFMRGPKRRDIGHGALAERALLPVIPDAETFPYTMRVVSEILESNGSSSMASVCGSTLSLMDAGVPILAPVAGIAMGLIKEGDDLIVLTDIQGAEDHLGDMDFKVAGTADGITALQMDIKISGVSTDLLRRALGQAKDARLHILGKMAEALAEPRSELSEYAPQVLSIKIESDQIGLLIGKGGETIRGLEEEFEVKIDIEEDGFVRLYASDGVRGQAARDRIDEMTRPISVGDVYTGRRVVKTADFGAFVEIRKGTDGLLHVSRVAPGLRIDSIEQVLDRGDLVNVEVTEIDRERGRIALKLLGKMEGDVEITPEVIATRYREKFPNAGQGGDRPERPRAAATAAATGARGGIARAPEQHEHRTPRRGFHERRVADLNVALAGDEAAPPLVLLHGLGASWQAWRAVGERLSRRAPGDRRRPSRVRALAGARRAAGFPLPEVAERLGATLDELGVSRHVVAGPLDGRRRRDRARARATRRRAGDRAARSRRADRDRRRAPLVASAAAAPRRSRELTRVVAPLLPHSRALRQRAFARLVADPLALDEQTMRELALGSRLGRSTGAAGTAIVHAGLRDRIDRLQVPVLVVFGEEDRVIDPAGGPRLAAALPSAPAPDAAAHGPPADDRAPGRGRRRDPRPRARRRGAVP